MDSNTTEEHETTGGAKNSNDLSVSRVLELLSNRDRRYLLYRLAECEGESVAIDEIVEFVLSRYARGPGTSPTEREIRTRLCHAHLPKLAESNVVSFHRDENEIHYTPDPTLEYFLSTTVRLEDEPS